MTPSASLAKLQLTQTLDRGLGVDYDAQGVPTLDRELRHSAVLILFGALDHVPANFESMRATGGTSHADGPISPDLDVLLTRRSDSMRFHAGQIAFPGGGRETDDDNLVATALREAQEETGLDPEGVEILGTLPDILIPVSNNLVTPVVGWWRLPSEVAADHSESVEVFRVPVAEMLNPAMRGTSVLNHGEIRHRGAAFKLTERFGGHLVWGFTGMVLSSVFAEVGWEQPWSRQNEFPVV